MNARTPHRYVLEETRGQHALEAWKDAINPKKAAESITGINPNAKHTLDTWKQAIAGDADGNGRDYVGPMERALNAFGMSAGEGNPDG